MTLLEQAPQGTMHTVGLWLSPAGIGAAFLSVAHLMPVIAGTAAGFAAAFFYFFQILDSPHVQAFFKRRRERIADKRKHRGERRMMRRIHRLQLKQAMIVGELKRLGVLSSATTTMQGSTENTQLVVEHPPSDKS